MGVDVALETPVVAAAALPPAAAARPTFARPTEALRTLMPTRRSLRPRDRARRRDAAAAAANLDELRGLDRFEGCGLRKTATQLVFADGTPGSRAVPVGEAPGRDEDIQGLPFVGRSGQLLDRMLAAIGLDRTSVYIANVVPWRPPGNRTPTPQETAACRPFIAGRSNVRSRFPGLLGAPAPPADEQQAGHPQFRGQWRDFDTGTRTIRAMATLHPAISCASRCRRLAWRDFLMLREALDASPARP
jgi:DNA polymerase